MDKLTKYTQVEHLQKTNELVDKVNELKPVATTGSYNDLTDTPEEITSASKEKTGIVKIGENINVDDTGTISVSKDNVTNALGYIPVNPEEIEEYTLPVANDATLGGVKIGSNINVTEDGTISLNLDKETVIEALGYTPPEQDTNTTYEVMTGATKEASGTSGLVPAPLQGETNKYLKSDGTWSAIEASDSEQGYLYVGDDIPKVLYENLICVDPDELLEPEPEDNIVIGVTEKDGVVTVTKKDQSQNKFYAGLNILARNKEYQVGDIAYSPDLPSWAYLECVVAGTTGATAPDFSGVDENSVGGYE